MATIDPAKGGALRWSPTEDGTIESLLVKTAGEIKTLIVQYAKDKFGSRFPQITFSVKLGSTWIPAEAPGILIATSVNEAHLMESEHYGEANRLVLLPDGLYLYNRLALVPALPMCYLTYGIATMDTMDTMPRPPVEEGGLPSGETV